MINCHDKRHSNELQIHFDNEACALDQFELVEPTVDGNISDKPLVFLEMMHKHQLETRVGSSVRRAGPFPFGEWIFQGNVELCSNSIIPFKVCVLLR
ncbi:hypothetical protein ASG33_09875 [Dyadobacter sp. Leaf189]|nr:hypothetical protein ASG33_09875 [Dyadobacter sp. Leaf189]